MIERFLFLFFAGPSGPFLFFSRESRPLVERTSVLPTKLFLLGAWANPPSPSLRDVHRATLFFLFPPLQNDPGQARPPAGCPLSSCGAGRFPLYGFFPFFLRDLWVFLSLGFFKVRGMRFPPSFPSFLRCCGFVSLLIEEA